MTQMQWLLIRDSMQQHTKGDKQQTWQARRSVHTWGGGDLLAWSLSLNEPQKFGSRLALRQQKREACCEQNPPGTVRGNGSPVTLRREQARDNGQAM